MPNLDTIYGDLFILTQQDFAFVKMAYGVREELANRVTHDPL